MKNYLAVVLSLSFVFSTLSCNYDTAKPDVIRGVWMVQTLKSSNVDFVPAAGDTLFLDFKDANSYGLRLTQNICRGNYSINSNGDISFDSAGCTKVGGDSEESFVFRAILKSVTKFFLEEDQLIISGLDDEIQLRRLNR